jgi:hypothetical protein
MDLWGYIFPMRIALGEQLDFLLPAPFLNPLFALGRYLGIAVRFKIDQAIDLVPFRETVEQSGFVLRHSLSQIVGEAHI